ncbi:cytochrome P450 [Spinellus fusiger]|nr:cytochrome P450 [Spinellus fusiger]
MIDLLKEHPLQTAGVVAVGTALYALYSSSKDKETGGFDKIPTPKGKYPYLGHIPHLGPILHIKMGIQDFIFVSDPDIAHEIFNINGSITSLRPPNKFGDDCYSKVNGIMAPKAVDQMGDAMQFETSHLIDQLIKNGSTNEGVDPFNNIALQSLNVILRICLGTRMDSIEDPNFQNIVDIVQLTLLYGGVDENIDAYIPALSFISYLKGTSNRNRDFIDNLRNPVLERMIKQAIERNEDCLVKIMRDSLKNTVYDNKDILVLISDMMIAGTDTVSLTISWAFAVLSHHPKVQKKICEEIDAFITNYKRLPTFKERDEFPYMISVQREIMRLYPTIAHGVPHKGTTLLSSVYTLHRNSDSYPDPEKFIPERFINNKSTLYASANGNIKERDQYNFGWGRRICPGIYLAETELFLTYTTLWARCTIEPALDSNGKPVYADIESFVDGGLVIMPKHYKVRFVERADKLL